MAKVILIGYDGPGSGAAVVKCIHFTDADEANRYRASDTECFRFLTVRNPGGVRKQNENYKAPEAAPLQGTSPGDGQSHKLETEGSTPSPATNQSAYGSTGADADPGLPPDTSASAPPLSGKKKQSA